VQYAEAMASESATLAFLIQEMNPVFDGDLVDLKKQWERSMSLAS